MSRLQWPSSGWISRIVIGVALSGVLAASLALGSGPRPASARQAVLQEDTLAELAAEVRDAVVRIDVRTEDGSRQGSGFLVSSAGRLLTNYHVVRNAQNIEVRLASGDVYHRAGVVAVDERRDIAVLQVPGFSLPSLPLGNSDSVQVGTDVVAIGSPLGLDNTVSTGIVSGRRREPEGYRLLQVTTPAAQGSSGGPILTRAGRVVGIAVSRMQGGENLNFAVPINYARGMLAHADTAGSLALLRAGRVSPRGEPVGLRSGGREVNRGLRFSVDSMRGYTFTMEGTVGEGRTARRRVTYRRINAVGRNSPRIERYAEYEVTRRTGPFQTRQAVRRERSRVLVRADDLQPLSVQGETAWWSGDDWLQIRYELEFDGYHVEGTIQDTAGGTRKIDRDLPAGVLLHRTRNLAFATLNTDTLLGHSAEFTTFDASSGEVRRDRYDIRRTETVDVGDRSYPALRVNVASGVDNSVGYFRKAIPRVLLRRRSDAGLDMKTTELKLFGRESDGS